MSRLDEIEARLKAATAGPWKVGYSDGSGAYDAEEDTVCISDVRTDRNILHAKLIDNESDASFIAHAPEDMRYLLERLRKCERGMRDIQAIQNKDSGGDWDEIAEARLIARAYFEEYQNDSR